MKRFRLQIIGESGSGLLSTGEIVTNALKDAGYYIVADREYPSLIKGGFSCFSLNFGTEPIYSLSEFSDVMLALDKQSLEAYHPRLRKGGQLIHGYEKVAGLKEVLAKMDCEVTAVHGREIAKEQGGLSLMVNIVLTGVLWKVLGLDYELIETEVRNKFAHKPKFVDVNLRCLKAGYDIAETKFELEKPVSKHENKIIVDGNKAIALGAVHAGVRAYYAYPMSPSSTILSHISTYADKTGIVVKQAEDEITAAQMAMGSMYAGTRSMTATSGGGFDLMTETVSVAGIIENPLVIVIAQRPGPGTGLPTWTAQGDLNLAINSGHGEYAKMVIAVSDPVDAFDLIQHALNYAEEFQMPVILLTEKVIAETIVSIDPFEQYKIPIKRGLVAKEELAELKNSDRYKISEDGLSKRWVPGSAEAYYFANGDEHWESGELSEEAVSNELMYAKRNIKLETLEKALPEPEVFGDAKGADISFIGWGSTKNIMLDMIRVMAAQGIKVNYLHYSYVYPLKIGRLNEFFAGNKNVHLIEGNYQGQLGQYISAKSDHKFKGKLLKFNGRPFFVEDLESYITNNK
jgi:2-oxoglutarate ferredoxin oxidoreductase subunit alpha